jgi:hypothetical protein
MPTERVKTKYKKNLPLGYQVTEFFCNMEHAVFSHIIISINNSLKMFVMMFVTLAIDQ